MYIEKHIQLNKIGNCVSFLAIQSWSNLMEIAREMRSRKFYMQAKLQSRKIKNVDWKFLYFSNTIHQAIAAKFDQHY